MKFIIAPLLISLFFTILIAEENTDTGWGIGFHPIMGYDDEVRLTLGGACVLYYEHEDKNRELDEIDINSTYNMKNQCDLMFFFNKYLKDNQWSLEGETGYQNYPDDFENKDYNPEYFPFEIEALYNVSNHFYMGPLYKFKYSHIDFEDQDFEDQLTGAGYVHYSGLGWKMVYKNMSEGQIYRRKGQILELMGIHYSPYFLSSEEFSKVNFDYRQYNPIFSQSVFAFQFTVKSSFGKLPFNYIHDLENKGILRGGGEKSGRYMMATQLEYRFPIFRRIGGAVFGGTGNAQNEISELFQDLSFAIGAGPRITLNKKKNITLRFDFAVNNKSEKNIYIKIKEAF